MNKAEELIACLEGEIAKRDARIVELDKKYGWALSELAAIKAQEPSDHVRALNDALTFGIGMIELNSDGSSEHVPAESIYAAPVSEAKAQGVGSPIRFWIIGDAGQKKGATLCKKSSRDGSLAFFETEEDATRAAKRHAGTAVYSVDYYKSAPLMMPERSNECGSDGELTYEAKAHNRCLDEVARLNVAHVQHPDDDAVDRFAVAMKVKLAASREKGRHGWQNATGPHLSSLLHEHMFKGDPLDVGNLAMMLHQNGQAIELPHDARRVTPPVHQVSVTDGWRSMVDRLASTVENLNEVARGQITDDMEDPDYEHGMCDKHDDLVREARAMLAAAPAAPAADAGLVLEQAMYALIGIGYHENSGLVHELRQSLAAHRAKGVV